MAGISATFRAKTGRSPHVSARALRRPWYPTRRKHERVRGSSGPEPFSHREILCLRRVGACGRLAPKCSGVPQSVTDEIAGKIAANADLAQRVAAIERWRSAVAAQALEKDPCAFGPDHKWLGWFADYVPPIPRDKTYHEVAALVAEARRSLQGRCGSSALSRVASLFSGSKCAP